MSTPLPVTIAWQGLIHLLPAQWEVAASYGTWRTGNLLLAHDRLPVLRLSWDRSTARPDLQRTLARAQRRLAKETGFAALPAVEPIADDGALARCAGRDGELSVAVRHLPGGVTAIWRQLRPGSGSELRAIAGAAVAARDGEPVPWRMHGIDVVLPPGWRCEALQALAGLARGVWFHERGRLRRVDQVLILRRMACAGRVLAGRTVDEWLRAHLYRRETASTETLGDGAVHLTCRRPASNWWRRLRGGEDHRHLHAWIDADADRLTVQEWAGSGEPLTCLRNGPSAQGNTPSTTAGAADE